MKIIAAIAVGLAVAGVLSATPASAQNNRTFVSAHGSDSAACSLAAPCRTLAVAFVATNPGGEIDVLDPAGYGALTINKAISIVNDGVGTSSVLVPSSGIGITISALTTDAVSLRGLTIEGAGAGATGIQFNSGKSLTVTNCVIRHMTGHGIDYKSTTANSILTVSSSLVADNGGSGIVLEPTDSATAMFNRVEAINNAFEGILVTGGSISSNQPRTVNATAFDTVASGNGHTGFQSFTTLTSAVTNFMISHSVAANNGVGVEATNIGATLRLAHATVTGNVNGWAADGVGGGGVVDSYADNYIDGNGMNETAPPVVVHK
jgi:hypothetical protein